MITMNEKQRAAGGKWRSLLSVWTLLVLCSVTTGVGAADEEFASQEHTQELPKSPSPHIFFVLIDDLGWGDVGFHQPLKDIDYPSKTNNNREIQTPFMDRLVLQEGIELRRHYVHSTCTGTRTSLQSGRFPVHVQTSLKYPEDPSSGMPRNLTGLAEYMKYNAANKYLTHYVGKWDAGMASPKHTPKGRGYDTSLNYFEHKNDFWTQECAQSKCCDILVQKQQQQQQQLQQQQQQHKQQQPTQNSNKKRELNAELIKDLWDTDRPARDLVGTDFEEFIFQRRMLQIIDDHASKEEGSPLFLFYAPHVAHCPLQVPQEYLDKFDFMDLEGNDETMCSAQTANILHPDTPHQPKYSCRKQYRAMVNLLDDTLRSIVDRLKQRDMWDNTIMIVTSDNGGPTDPKESGSTNFPLRGGKYTDWEGGVRATAFVSGGYLPEDRRGKILNNPIHICNWYATLPAFAGVNVIQEEENKRKQEESHIPPIDAINIWPLIVGNDRDDDDTDNDVDNNNDMQRESSSSDTVAAAVPRSAYIPLSYHALIVGDYKLLWNEQHNISISGWTTEDYPNKQTSPTGINHVQMNCTQGCLYNVHTDPGEHVNLASTHPRRVQQMKRLLVKYRDGFFENDDTGVDSCPEGYNDNNYTDGDDSLPCACWMAVNYYGGFLGPYQEVDMNLSEKEHNFYFVTPQRP